MFRITRDPSSGSSIQCLAKITVIDVVGVMAAYLPMVLVYCTVYRGTVCVYCTVYRGTVCVYCTVKRGTVCVLHKQERHCVCTAQSRQALFV